MDETFFLSNMAPQVGAGFNRHCECFIPFQPLFFETAIDISILGGRLGVSRRLVSTLDRDVPRCVCFHFAALFAKAECGREMACGMFPVYHFVLSLAQYYTDTRSNRIATCKKWFFLSTRDQLLMSFTNQNVSVPTHFAKVVLATRPANPANPSILEASIGAFVLPNAIIPDDAPLESFSLPGPSTCASVQF